LRTVRTPAIAESVQGSHRQEVKMADIRKDDVRTYVRELIAKDFGSNNIGKKVYSDRYRDEHHQPFYNQSLKEE
jgi:hypothetical protein